MNERSYWREWPLAVFTVAIQVASGLAFAAVVLDWRDLSGQQSLARTAAYSVFPTVLFGVLVSLLHLGRPLSMWRALANTKSSRLSQEIVAVTVFAAGALAYGAIWYGGASEMRLGCGVATVMLGAVAVIANARVYRVPAQPHARAWWMVVSFFSVALLVALWPIFSWR